MYFMCMSNWVGKYLWDWGFLKISVDKGVQYLSTVKSWNWKSYLFYFIWRLLWAKFIQFFNKIQFLENWGHCLRLVWGYEPLMSPVLTPPHFIVQHNDSPSNKTFTYVRTHNSCSQIIWNDFALQDHKVDHSLASWKHEFYLCPDIGIKWRHKHYCSKSDMNFPASAPSWCLLWLWPCGNVVFILSGNISPRMRWGFIPATTINTMDNILFYERII